MSSDNGCLYYLGLHLHSRLDSSQNPRAALPACQARASSTRWVHDRHNVSMGQAPCVGPCWPNPIDPIREARKEGPPE